MIDKQTIPTPSDILNELLSPDDIIKEKNMEAYTTLAKNRSSTLQEEIMRRKKLDGLKEALEEEDFDRLSDIYREMYGETLVSAGKKLIISTLALKGLRVDDEVHVEETAGDWIENVYNTKGIQGLMDWTEQIDTALQVIDEYKVVFESQQAKDKNRKDNQLNFYQTIEFSNPFRS